MATINELKMLTLAEGITARAINSESMTVSHVTLEKDATVPEHTHPHEQIVNVISGTMDLEVAGVTHRLSAGSYFVLESNVPHAARAVTDCYVIDVFQPVREDFR